MLLSLLACTGAPDPVVPVPEPLPDIVLVVIDTLRADHLGFMGHERPTSPNLDAWAAKGTVYTHAISHSGWTLPSTATLLTGRLPHEHGAISLPSSELGRLVETSFGRLKPEMETLAEVASSLGYATAGFVNNTFLREELGLGDGFETYDYANASQVSHRSAEDTVEQALSWWEAQQKPRFLWVHVMEPHMDYMPPAPYAGTFAGDGEPPLVLPLTEEDRTALLQNTLELNDEQKSWLQKVYDEEILATDAALKPLLSATEGAVVAVTSDHGEEFWDHGDFEHGHSLHWELLNVPMVLVGPGVGAQRLTMPSSHIDLHAALLRAMRGEPTQTPLPDGRSFVVEDCVHTNPQTGIVGPDARLFINLDNQQASLWRFEGGQELPWTDEQARDATAEPLFNELMRVRGSLERASGEGIGLDDEDRERLRLLGYLDE